MITVDSRQRDPKSEMVVKYESPNGNPIQWKPVRHINPDMYRLTPLASFIAEHQDGAYIGGFHHRSNDVRVEGALGSQYTINEHARGASYAEDCVNTWGISRDARATIRGWLFPVFEPGDDETEYFNHVAERIAATAGAGGRVIIKNAIYEVAA